MRDHCAVRRYRDLLLIAAAEVVLLLVFAHGYGYHRDELYFLAAGRHLAWSYADQGPLTPFAARVMSEIAPGSLTVLRIPSALAAGLMVVLTGLLAREFGADRRAELTATLSTAVGNIVLFNGHLLSTSTFDLLDWTAVSWLVMRALRDERLWLLAGLALGIGLLNKPLPAFFAIALLVSVIAVGPRSLLRSKYVWAGGVIAILLWLPWIIWQAANGWPQIDVSRSIAAGGSTSSQPWWAIVPFQFLLISPVLAPIWIAGLIRLLRDARWRFLGISWILLAVIFMATGGKPYYLAGMFPLLLAAGAPRFRLRRDVAIAIALSLAVNAVISLPLLPAHDAGPVIALNPDVGETIGWPDLVHQVAAVRRKVPGPVVILTSNYGEAGAIDRYGPALGLPRAYSGHNAFGDWGPPPDRPAEVVTVGGGLDRHLRGCRAAAHIGNHAGVDNDEKGAPIMICTGPRTTWSQEWPSIKHLG
jgi:hypothetical protein